MFEEFEHSLARSRFVSRIEYLPVVPRSLGKKLTLQFRSVALNVSLDRQADKKNLSLPPTIAQKSLPQGKSQVGLIVILQSKRRVVKTLTRMSR